MCLPSLPGLPGLPRLPSLGSLGSSGLQLICLWLKQARSPAAPQLQILLVLARLIHPIQFIMHKPRRLGPKPTVSPSGTRLHFQRSAKATLSRTHAARRCPKSYKAVNNPSHMHKAVMVADTAIPYLAHLASCFLLLAHQSVLAAAASAVVLCLEHRLIKRLTTLWSPHTDTIPRSSITITGATIPPPRKNCICSKNIHRDQREFRAARVQSEACLWPFRK